MALKKLICLILALTMVVFLPACKSDTAQGDAGKKTLGSSMRAKSVEKDDNLGLMNIKIQDADDLSNIEKLLVQYFDTDYFANPAYNNLQRYPTIYENSQIYFQGVVSKIIESNNDSYTLLIEYGAHKTYDERKTLVPTNMFAVIKGKQQTTRIIEGDQVVVYGKYMGVDTYNVDGKSHTVPTIQVNRYCFALGYDMAPLYSMEEIRSIAKYIFGDNINIKDISSMENGSDDFSYLPGQMYVVELENQSNANFRKYSFDAIIRGRISDMNSQWPEERNITFSADFKHFYLQIFNHELKTYSLSCYDLDLNKIWTRDFDQTTTAVADYTRDHIYLVANGSMYIINTKDGENAIEPKYVGPKTGIRKLSDGILLTNYTKSDAIMKTDLVGNVLWTTNIENNMADPTTGASAPIIQIINGNYVFEYDATYDNGTACGKNVVVITPDGKKDFEGSVM